MPVVQYTAALRTRKTTSASNAKSNLACQEFYDSSYNYVGIICFPGMNLTGKVIVGIQLTVTAAQTGYGANTTKNAYLCTSNYQNNIIDGVTGAGYAGAALGTMPGSFYNNSTTTTLSGDLFTNVAAYLTAGNNTFTLYNPSPVASPNGYSMNYFQWSQVIITVGYEEAASVPTVSSSSVDMGSTVTIYTNRATAEVTHTISYTFGNASGVIAYEVDDSVSWGVPLSLANQIPNATSGTCTITCQSYHGGVLTGTRTCTLTLNVPVSIAPSISSITANELNTTVSEKIGSYVKLLSQLAVAVSASGAQSSTIVSYRTVLDGVTYSDASFISGKLQTSGNLTISVTVTDSRGRTATDSLAITVLDYSYPSIRQFEAARCNSDGTEAQVDGNKVFYSFEGGVSPLGNKNGLSAVVYYKLTSASAWTKAESMPITAYTLTKTNKLLDQTYDPLASYDLKVRLSDFFYYCEQVVSLGTKQVILDILSDGSGIGIGKMAETSGRCEIGWPVTLTEPLSIANGGTGGNTAAKALSALGAVNKTGDTMTGDLAIQGTLTPALKLQNTYNSAKSAALEGSYAGSAAVAALDDTAGTNKRVLEVRTKGYESSLDNALLLRTCEDSTWKQYRVFHAGMASAVPVDKGGTGSTTAAGARSNLGCNDAGNLSTGTVAMARLPFKVAYGSGQISGSTALTINYASAGFTQVPFVVACYSQTDANWAGDNGCIKISSKNTAGAAIIVGGNFTTLRSIDWLAVGI